MRVTKAEKEALEKVYAAMREASAVEGEHYDASDWLFWREFHEMKSKVWNAIGCPKSK